MRDSAWWLLLRRQTLAFLLIFITGIVLTIVMIVYAPRKYQSHAKLLLKLGRENISVDPTVTTTGELVSLHRTFESEINTSLHTMASREVLESVVDQISSEVILRGSLDEPSGAKRGLLGSVKATLKGWLSQLDPIDNHERAVLELQNNLVIDAAKASSVVDVTFKTKTPELAQRVTQCWVDTYLQHHSKINATAGSLDFFVTQEAALIQALNSARDKLQNCKSRHGMVTVSGEQQTLESQIRWARSNIVETKATLLAAEARLKSLQNQRRQADPKIVTGESSSDTNEAQDRMRDRLFILEIEERRLASKYKPEHPKYAEIQDQLRDARDLFQQQKPDSLQVVEGLNPLYASIEEQIARETANIDSLDANRTATSEMLERLLEESVVLNQHETEIAKLQLDVDILETRYHEHAQKLEQARLVSELESQQIGNVKVFQMASLERLPISPNKKMVALLGIVGSLMSAFGFVAMREAVRANAAMHLGRVASAASEPTQPNATALDAHPAITPRTERRDEQTQPREDRAPREDHPRPVAPR